MCVTWHVRTASLPATTVLFDTSSVNSGIVVSAGNPKQNYIGSWSKSRGILMEVHIEIRPDKEYEQEELLSVSCDN